MFEKLMATKTLQTLQTIVDFVGMVHILKLKIRENDI